jgi:GT2 family glycosyltransferase
MTRRPPADWGRPMAPPREDIQVLIPTCNRPAELAVTLAGLAAQEGPAFGVIISDQSDGEPPWETPAVLAMVNVLAAQGIAVRTLRHLPRQGLAEHRQFLLEKSSAPYILFLDDDVWLEPNMLGRMAEALETHGCGFIGSAVQGLSFLGDRRPQELEPFEPWEGKVQPERIRPDTPEFGRWTLHNAANLVHLAEDLAEKQQLPQEGWLAYKVAWVGGCVLFDRQKLVDCGGFSFWKDLPEGTVGEDVAAQWKVMERHGGAGLLPSGAVHLEAPTTIAERPLDAYEVVFGDAVKPAD